MSKQLQESLASKDGPKVNTEITATSIRLIDENGDMVGVVNIREALDLAYKAELDLVEISPLAEPPVCKILDYGKYRYEIQKKQAEARKKQKTIEVKELKLTPRIEDNDYQVKLRSILRFLEEGNKVKISMRFKGREITHKELGMQIFDRIQTDLGENAKIEQPPKLEGFHAIMMLAPK